MRILKPQLQNLLTKPSFLTKLEKCEKSNLALQLQARLEEVDEKVTSLSKKILFYN